MNVPKANQYTFILTGLGVFLFAVLAQIEGARGDFGGPQVEGGIILSVIALFAISLAALGFSLVYRISRSLPINPVLGFWAVLIAAIVIVSMPPAIVLHILGFGYEPNRFLRGYAITTGMLAFATLPLALFWWIVARKT